MKHNILNLDYPELEAWVEAQNLPAYHAQQIYSWLGRGVSSFAEMTNLSKDLRAKLEAEFWRGWPRIAEVLESPSDFSRKYLLSYPDGEVVEAVLMPHRYGISACLSTQVGCSMACAFCASTGLEQSRNLSQGDLLGQFQLLEQNYGQKITNLDLMGIGEPLANYKQVVGFIKTLCDPDFRDFSVRKICLSTCGLLPEIRQLAREGLGLTLSISLHAASQKKRAEIMPIARKYPLDDLLETANYYFEQTGRRISYEYALFAGFNDSCEDALALARLLKGQNCHVNLIPANLVPGRKFRPSAPTQVEHFALLLNAQGINATVRQSRGQDIAAACGQLRRSKLLEA